MLQRTSLALLVVGLIFWLPARASDLVYPGGGVLAEIVDGGGFQTTITLVNLDSLPAPYTLKFYDDNGNPLTLSTTAGPPSTQLTGTLLSGGSTVIKTNGGASTSTGGWAVLQTTFTQDSAGLYHYTVGGSAIIGLWLPGNPLAECSVPLDTGQDTLFAIPFDHTGAAVTGVALANTYQTTPLTVNVKAYDPSGTSLFTDTLQIPGMGHTSFLLTDKYPQLAGKQGMVEFSGTGTDQQNNPNGYMNVLGLRATSTALSSVTPLVPCYYVSTSSGTGCTN